MKKNYLYLNFLLVLIMVMSSCGNTEKKHSLNENVVGDNWRFKWHIKPDSSIDTISMNNHYKKYTERWDSVFNFLQNSDLQSLTIGEHEILGEDVYAIISEYYPKDIVECNFETHLKYIDLQYVICGVEMMGIAKLNDVIPITEYNEEKDIIFYEQDTSAFYTKANTDAYFVFFPDDAHCPSIKVEDNLKIKKIVVKIRYE